MFVDLNLREALKLIDIRHESEMTITKRKHRRKMVKWVKSLISEHGIKKTHYEYVRSIGNSLHHGKCPVHGQIFIGSRGEMICAISDQGEGFNYRETVAKRVAKQVYFKGHGYGMRCLGRNPDLNVGWQDGGRTILLLYNTKVDSRSEMVLPKLPTEASFQKPKKSEKSSSATKESISEDSQTIETESFKMLPYMIPLTLT